MTTALRTCPFGNSARNCSIAGSSPSRSLITSSSVPLTIGLAFLVAIMQVLAYRRKDAVWERLTRFFGTLFLIN